MEVSIIDITDVEKEIQIQASAQELEPHFEEAYRRMLPKIELKGFRKGKAPLGLVKKIHGEAIEYESLDTVASDMYKQVVQERDIHPIGEPVLTEINYKRGEALRFKIKYEIKPQIELKAYTGIAVEKLVHKVTEQEVQDEILRLRRSNSMTEPGDAASTDEHIVTADVQQLDEAGSPLIGKKTSDTRIYLADEQVFPEIKEALRNSSVGDIRRVKIDTQHEDHKHTDHIELTVKKIERVQLPELDDEFVSTITKGKTTTVDAFDKQLRADIEAYWKDRGDRKLYNDLIAEIVRRHDFVVPESMIRAIQDSMIEELKSRSPNKHLPSGFDERQFREQSRGSAIFQAKWYLLRERIVEAERISATDADIEQMAARDAERTGIERERLLNYYKTSDQVKDRIVSDKLMAFLTERNSITERVTDEFIE
jgi:trigger factor